jgi:hypothetical protein
MMAEKALFEGHDKIRMLFKQLFGCDTFIITLNTGPIFKHGLCLFFFLKQIDTDPAVNSKPVRSGSSSK